jgi:cytochrome P450
MFALLRDPRGFLTRRHRRHGDVFRSRLGLPVIFLVGPEANKTIHVTRRQDFSYLGAYGKLAVGKIFERSLITQDGAEHQHDRDILQPAVGRLALSESLETIWKIWEGASRALAGGKAHDAHRLVQRLTFEVSANVLVGLKLREELDQYRPLFQALVDGTMAGPAMRFPFGRLARALRARERLISVLSPRIEAAREEAPRGMLGLLAHHRDPDGTPLSTVRIAEHLLLLYWAGYDTTASTGSWMLYELARAPEWQERVADELRRSLPSGQRPTLEQLHALPVLGMVLKEVERLRPAALLFPRSTLQELEILGHRIPRGTLVFYSPYLTHRDERLFPDPDTFNPGRWDPALGDRVAPSTALVGFGGGPRVCLGKAFALLQLRVMAATLIGRYRIELRPSRVREVPLPMFHPRNVQLVFRPRGEVPARDQGQAAA